MNLEQFARFVKLEIRTAGNAGIIIVFYGLGRQFHGLAGASCVLTQHGSAALIGDMFQVNYRDRDEAVHQRFHTSLEGVLTGAITKWSEHL